MSTPKRYDCHCHMDGEGNSPVFYLASEVDPELDRLRAENARYVETIRKLVEGEPLSDEDSKRLDFLERSGYSWHCGGGAWTIMAPLEFGKVNHHSFVAPTLRHAIDLAIAGEPVAVPAERTT